jgi:hypothetical protein
MNYQSPVVGPDSLIRTLAEFRFEMRRFLHFSESAALEAGLQPQQHQLLFVDRSEREGLLTRAADPDDKRRAILKVTQKGNQILGRLSGDHARELNELAPLLLQALEAIRMHERIAASVEAR